MFDKNLVKINEKTVFEIYTLLYTNILKTVVEEFIRIKIDQVF